MMKLRRLAVVTAWFSLTLFASGCADSIINGSCSEGFISDGQRCVPVGGVDAGDDGSVDAGDGALADGMLDAGIDASEDAGDGAAADGAVDGSTDGGTEDGGPDAAMDAGDDAATDAATDAGMDAEMDAGSDADAGGCPMGFLTCGALCVDPMGSDPDNCGGCNVRCTSGICLSGMCADDRAGHIVLIGHDYVDSRIGMNRIAGNALFLAPGTVDAAVFEGTAPAASIAGIDDAFNQRATEQLRTWNRITVTSDQVPASLATNDALIILPQDGTSDTDLRQLGMDWAAAIDAFVNDGGVVVLFDTSSVSNAGTWQILEAAGQFMGTGTVSINLDTVTVANTADAVALDVPASYRSEVNSLRFITTDPDVVVAHPMGPVVLHRVIF